jgi:hypothetical protein
LERICDTCMHSILVKQAEDEIAEVKQQISGELSISVLEREEKTRLINKALGRLRKLRIESREKVEKHKKEEEALNKTLQTCSDDLERLQMEALELEKVVNEQFEEERNERERVRMTQEDHDNCVKIVWEKEKCVKELEYKTECMKKDAVRQLSLNAFKKNLCVLCNNLLANEFPDKFQEIPVGSKTSKQKLDNLIRQTCKCHVF